MQTLKRLARAVVEALDARDAFFWLGLWLCSCGFAAILSPAYAALFAGVVFLGVALFGGR